MDKNPKPVADNIQDDNGDIISRVNYGDETVIRVNWSAIFRELGAKMGIPTPVPGRN